MPDPAQKLDVTNKDGSEKKLGTGASGSGSLTEKILMESDGSRTAGAARAQVPAKTDAAGAQPLTGKSVSETVAAANKQEEASKPSNPFQVYSSSYHPVQTALSARLGYHGLKGNLLLDKPSAIAMLTKTGPLGEQLAERVAVMEGQGWSIGRLKLDDPYLKSAFKNPIKRALMFPQVAGYNSLYHDNVLMKRITYNSWSHLANQSMTSFGEASPATRVAGNLAHELGHWDRVPLPEVSQLKNMSVADQRVFARRLLQTETNAILPQLHVSEKLGAYHADVEIYREALKSGRLGSLLRTRWLAYGNIYNTFEHISPAEADAFVKEVLDTNYKGVVKPNGSVAAYDLNAIRGKYFGTTGYDEAILARIDNPAKGVQVAESRLVTALSEGRTGAVLRRGGQAAAGVAVALVGTEIAAAFYESPQKGIAKTGRAAFTWGAFEAGSAVGAAIGAPIARMAMKTKYGYLALPLASIFTGMAAASTLDMAYGSDIEKSIQNSLNTKPEDELRKTLLGK